jgi:hypothetical protein
MNNENNVQAEELPVMDLTSLNKEKKTSILPNALRAANFFNDKNSIGAVETQLPVSGIKIVCNPISSIDEITAKTIMGSIQMYMEHNLKLFYGSIIFPEDSYIKTFEEFLTLTEADFKAIVYGVMKASYKTLNQTTFICQNKKCSNPDKDKTFQFTPQINEIVIDYPKGFFESPNNDFRKDSFIATLNNIKIIYKFDSILDRINLFKNKSNQEIRNNIQKINSMVPKVEMIPMFIDSVEIDMGDEVINLEDDNEIMVFISKLNSTSKEVVETTNNQYIEYILGYSPEFNSKSIECPHCKHQNEWEDIDLMVEFFLKISAIY